MRFKEIKEAYEDHAWDNFLSGSGAGNLLKSFGGNTADLLKKFPMLKGIIDVKSDEEGGEDEPSSSSTDAVARQPNTDAVARQPNTGAMPKQPNTGSPTPSKGPANQQQISSYLSSKGLSRTHVAGIMANIKHESNFNPAAIGDGGTSGGLFQHHGPRFQAMVRAAGRNWKTNWQGQIDFALSEPAGRQYASMPFRSAQEASKWWTMNFEIPANKVARANDRSRSASQYG